MAGYIGNAPVPQATQTRDNFTATAGQTSFATSGYTPGYLDVYLNGVRLDESDYTATNGSDVVLDTGAAVDDVVSVVAFQTFEVAGDEFTLTDITAQDSNGIQFNTDEGTERARIDDSGNVHVGKTSTSTATIGTTLLSNGRVTHTASNDSALELNRTTSDGGILNFRKDNTTVGSIGSYYGDAYIGTGDTGLRFNDGTNQLWPFSPSGAGNLDNTVDLGSTGTRFKDLYLSGGVYLGGTGSANHLDDYEEGTWTPTVSGDTTAGTVSYINRVGKYTKIGNLVYIKVFVGYSSHNGTGFLKITGLPFTPLSETGFHNLGSPFILNLGFTGDYMSCFAPTNQDYLRFYGVQNNSSTVNVPCDSSSNIQIQLSGCYRTAS